jgi:hypothetical protein
MNSLKSAIIVFLHVFLQASPQQQEYCLSPLLYSFQNLNGPQGLTIFILRPGKSDICPLLGSNSKSCCDEQTIGQFPQQLKIIINQTNEKLAELDKLIARGDRVRQQLESGVNSINDALKKLGESLGGERFFQMLQEEVSVAGDPLNEVNDYKHYPLDQSKFFPENKTKFNQEGFMRLFRPFFSTSFPKILAKGFQEVFSTYKEERKKCFDHMLQLHSKFLCAACDYESSLVYESSGVLRVNISVCENITEKCRGFMEVDAEISKLESLEELQKRQTLVETFKSKFLGKINSLIINKDNEGLRAKEAIILFREAFNFYSPPDCKCKVIPFPHRKVYDSCKDASSKPCTSLCEKLLSRFGVQLNNLVKAGEEASGDARLLQASNIIFEKEGFNFDMIESGFEKTIAIGQAQSSTSRYSYRGIIRGLSLKIGVTLGFLFIYFF